MCSRTSNHFRSQSGIPVRRASHRPLAIARFWFSSADPSAPPRYGQLLFGDREGVRVYLYSTEEKFLATVDVSVLDAIAVDPEKLRDHALFPGRHPADIARLRIAPAGEAQPAAAAPAYAAPSAPQAPAPMAPAPTLDDMPADSPEDDLPF